MRYSDQNLTIRRIIDLVIPRLNSPNRFARALREVLSEARLHFRRDLVTLSLGISIFCQLQGNEDQVWIQDDGILTRAFVGAT